MKLYLNPEKYRLSEEQTVFSPALIYYKDILEKNSDKMIETAGGAERLWPHVKTHKSRDFVDLLMKKGIRRFKCATFPEAAMCAEAGAEAVILAYPLVGPSAGRFIQLMLTYPDTEFFAIGDDEGQIGLLSELAAAADLQANLLMDINDGLNRTGVMPGMALPLFEAADAMPGIRVRGMHVYDGHRHEGNLTQRLAAVEQDMQPVLELKKELEEKDIDCSIMVMGGTPSFPCHVPEKGAFLSPGTCMVQDYGYASSFPDLDFEIGAMVLTRVVSHPAEGIFTLDCGCKAVAADPPIPRIVIAGYEECETLMQNEEHLVLKMPEGKEELRPAIGTVLYGAPWHICPTSALYPELLIAENGRLIDRWKVTARNRY